MFELRFYSLAGEFKCTKIESFASMADATAEVTRYASAEGYTNIKLVDDDGDGFRFTGRTPGGRSGRNIAMGDWDYSDV